MVPKLKGELTPPPPLGVELRLAEPWELCSTTASAKEGSMAADVRRWGGYCRRTSSSGALTMGVLGATVSTSACWPVAIMAIRNAVDTADIWPARASAWACHTCAPARRYRTPAALGAPALSPGGPSAPSAPSPVYAGGFAGAPAALRAVPRSRSRAFTPVTRRSRSLVMSANLDSAAPMRTGGPRGRGWRPPR